MNGHVINRNSLIYLFNMDPKLLAKVTALYEKINAEREEKKQLKKIEKLAKAGKKGFTVFKTESNKLGVVIPEGIKANGLSRFESKHHDTIQEFLNDNTGKLLKL